VIFQGNYCLSVTGVLYAKGTAAAHIVFTVNDTTGFSTDTLTDAGGWHGVLFKIYYGTSTDTSTFQYCDISRTKFNAADYLDPMRLQTLMVERSLFVKNCNFFNNTTVGDCGLNLIRSEPYAGEYVEFDSCNFYNNNSLESNISINNYYGTTTVFHHNKLYDNRAVDGILQALTGNFMFTDNEVYQNEIYGGVSALGVITLTCNGIVKNNKIHHNVNQRDAVFYCSGGRIDFSGNLITNNQHTAAAMFCGLADGGGAFNLCCYNTIPWDSTFYTIRDNVIANNYSPFQGGAIKVNNVSAAITNNQIINNTSPQAGTIFIMNHMQSTYVIKNNIFFGNVTGTNSSANSPVLLAWMDSAHFEFDHNWMENTTSAELDTSGSANVFTIDTSTNIVGVTPGLTAPTATCNVTEDATISNFTTLSTSACINRGDTSGIITDPMDYGGNVRICGSKIDIGAYEYCPPILYAQNTLPIQQTVSIYPNPASTSLTIEAPEMIHRISIINLVGQVLMQQESTAQYCQLTNGYLSPEN
jgi:hypothetical protein